MNVNFETGGDGATATTHDWLTPPEILAALGPFDMDPCASQYQPWRTAATQFTIEDDGLAREWAGRVKFRLPGGGTAGTAGAPSVLVAYGRENFDALKRSGIAGYTVELNNAKHEETSDLFSEASC